MWEHKLELYDELVAKCPRFDGKGKTMPYTSANGHMFSLLNKEGELGIRFSKEVQQKYIQEFGTTIFTFEFRDLPMGLWGEILSGQEKNRQAIALADWISTGNDLFMVMGHELIHACMIGHHGDAIASVKERFGEEGKNAYMELISYQWEFEMLNQLPDVTQYRRDTITKQYKIYSSLWKVLKRDPK